jgi:hypothetical protein
VCVSSSAFKRRSCLENLPGIWGTNQESFGKIEGPTLRTFKDLRYLSEGHYAELKLPRKTYCKVQKIGPSPTFIWTM